MANIDSRTVDYELSGDIEVDCERAAAFARSCVLRAQGMAKELGVHYRRVRITIDLSAARGEQKADVAILSALVAAHQEPVYGAPDLAGYFDFAKGIYRWKGSDIYLTSKEKLFLFKLLVAKERLQGTELASATQALYRMRTRFGKDFPGTML